MLQIAGPATLSRFVEALVAECGASLLCVIRHGAVPERRREPFRLLVVLEPLELSRLRQVGQVVDAHRRHLMVDLVLFTPVELHDSLDVFPLEFVQMQLQPYDVLFGTDMLADVHVAVHDLQIQLQEDLKTKRLWLRQSYVYDHRHRRRLTALPIEAFGALIPVLRGMLHLHGDRVPVRTDDMLTAAAAAFGLDGPFLHNLSVGRLPALPPEDIVGRYLAVLDQLIARVELHGPPQ